MLLLGLLLMAAAGAFTGLLIADNLSGGPDYQVTVLGNDLVVMNSLAVFLSGVALALLFCLGLALIGLSRRARRPVGLGAHRRVSPQAYPAAEADTAGTRPVDPAEPVEPATYTAREEVPSEQEAAERDGLAAGPTAPERRGRIRHLFGH
ncbi:MULTISPECIES: hypothetical protein [unclassified Kitasatospora]|uniref:hypothetical protein n=1 Tax=unclassified Kitasatospora TaxID=2633591 RepID=UPI002F906A19